MIILIVILIVIGIRKKQPKRFWLYCIAAVIYQNVIGLLFSGSGSLTNPAQDGLITRYIRQYFNDGPEMAAFGLVVILLGWIPTIYICKKGYVKPNTQKPVKNMDK